jgi:phage antirepressor YoqD-like protein
MTRRRSRRREGLVTLTAAAIMLEVKLRTLTEWLVAQGWINNRQDRVPTPDSLSGGRMTMESYRFTHKDGRADESVTPLITRKGYREILDAFRLAGLVEEGKAHD